MADTINDGINWLLQAAQLHGFYILLLTIPLAVIQGLLGFFPYTTIIMLHISALGLTYGLAMSWLAGTIASIAVFLFFRSFLSGWFNRKMQMRIRRYEKWQNFFERYGAWAIVVLRTLPIMPNNLISFMASVSPIKPLPYYVSSVVGNLSHIWLFGLISSSVLMPGTEIRVLVYGYVGFSLLLITIFLAVQYRRKAGKSPASNRGLTGQGGSADEKNFFV
jgi:uncharacterized membrane protein YdjX (TVP38/TMEM64 family)